MGQFLTANAGGRFSVEFDETAGTGYRWTPVALPSGIQLEGDEMTANPALGGGGRHVFHFSASHLGLHQIDFELKRPWEDQAIKSHRVQVQVGT